MRDERDKWVNFYLNPPPSLIISPIQGRNDGFRKKTPTPHHFFLPLSTPHQTTPSPKNPHIFPSLFYIPPQITPTKHTWNVNEAHKFENYPSITTIIGKGKIRKICFFNNKSMEEIARLERKIVVMCKEGSFYKGSHTHTSNPNLYNDWI